MAWANREALDATLESGELTFYSRSRERLWRKGEESGFVQKIKSIRTDCDGDVLIYEIEQEGGIACHTGRASCFYRELQDGEWIATDPVLKDPQAIYGYWHKN